MQRQGATFAVSHEFEFLKSDDPLFRPCQVTLGPDGAMYVCDWRFHRKCRRGAGKLWGDGKHGRIYRVSWAGTKDKPALPLRGLDSWAKIAKQSGADLVKTLASANFSDRQHAQQELVRRGDKHRPQLLKLLEDDEQPLPGAGWRVPTPIAITGCGRRMCARYFRKLIGHPEADLCRLAAGRPAAERAATGNKAVHQNLVSALNDLDPAVKRALALAIGKVGAPGAADTLVNLLKFDDGKDRYLTDGILRGLERLGKPGIDDLLTLANSGVEKDWERVVTAFRTLRSPAAADALPELLKNVHLTGTDKVALIESFNNYLFDPPVSLAPVIHHLDTLVELSQTMPMTAELKKKIAAAQPVKIACLKVLAAGKALENPAAHKLALAVLGSSDHALQKGAILALGIDPAGAKLVGEQFLDKEVAARIVAASH